MFENDRTVGNVILKTILYFENDIRRINHFLKVYGYAKVIGELEGLDGCTQEILEVAAVLHDIGIKISEQKYHSSAGIYQEQEGPAVAKEILEQTGYDAQFIQRVMYLIGHHHTYDQIDGIDYQILVEADFMVNIDEDHMTREAVLHIRDKIFKTSSGLALIENNYLR